MLTLLMGGEEAGQAGEFGGVVFFEVFELLVGGLFALLMGGEEAGEGGEAFLQEGELAFFVAVLVFELLDLSGVFQQSGLEGGGLAGQRFQFGGTGPPALSFSNGGFDAFLRVAMGG